LVFCKEKRVILVFTALLIAGIMIWQGPAAFGQNSVLYWGSSGSNVTKVQSLLNRWGYYNGAIDGYYSGKTFRAVDGVVGPQTWAALGHPAVRQQATSKAVTGGASRGITDRDNVYLLARVIEGEAADESYEGKVAVGAVIVNRTQSGAFPNSLAGVIYQPHAFESVTNGQYTRPVTDETLRAAQAAINGFDPSGGALFFWNPYKKVSSWIWSRPVITQIGRHVFAR